MLEESRAGTEPNEAHSTPPRAVAINYRAVESNMTLSKGPESEKLRQQLLNEIQQVLKKRRLSLRRAASITGVSEAHFSRLVSGKKYYAPPYLLEVFAILGGRWHMDLSFDLPEPASLRQDTEQADQTGGSH